jgi:hypothetical protein
MPIKWDKYPEDVIVHYIICHFSYFDLDTALPAIGLPPKLAAKIKLTVYLLRRKRVVKHLSNNLTVTLYTVEGLLHREGDKPAMVYSDGSKTYMKKNVIHRDNGPAIWQYNKITDEFTIMYMRKGVGHRDGDLPAVITSNGNMLWFKNGMQNRANGLPSARYGNGDMHWTLNDKLHRVGKPAIVTSTGDMYYYENGIPIYAIS